MPDSAPSPKLRINLNLLHPKEIQSKLSEKFLKWLIGYGRFIVILVEVVVVGAFLTRFKLDADLDNLKTQIQQDLPYVEGLAVDEALINQTQTRLTLIDKTLLNSDRWEEAILELASQTPTSIQFLGLLLEERDDQNIGFRINASTLSNNDLAVMLNNLRSQDNFREINLASISFDNDTILFTITGTKVKI